MAYDGWIELNEVELINLSRTAQLAEALGIDTLWTEPASVQWIEEALGGVDYALISAAPWYDSGVPASAEFAGVVPLSMAGLDDSTLEASTIEYTTDGGSSGKARNKTLSIVASVAILASTDRGADYGKRWLDRTLRAAGAQTFCAGTEMRYFEFSQGQGLPAPSIVHRRNVSLTRGTSVTRKYSTSCSSTWMVTYTWTANDPFEYGVAQEMFENLGAVVIGSAVVASGTEDLVITPCGEYDFSPLYDPLYPALVPSPTAPDFYPAGWQWLPGTDIDRSWVTLDPVEPSAFRRVPVITLSSDTEARFIRVSIWGASAPVDGQCEPLWTAIVSYLPPDIDLIIDGEQQASYVWDGVSPVRRADSLVYGVDARPIQWDSFNDPAGLLVAIDVVEGAPLVTASLSLVAKSN